jgi:hypothetical protein
VCLAGARRAERIVAVGDVGATGNSEGKQRRNGCAHLPRVNVGEPHSAR